MYAPRRAEALLNWSAAVGVVEIVKMCSPDFVLAGIASPTTTSSSEDGGLAEEAPDYVEFMCQLG